MNIDIKFEKQKKQYNRVNDLYINKSYTIEKACEKVGICKQTYYSIKKKMNSQKGGSVNNKEIIDKPEKKSHVRNILNVIDSKIQETGITV